MRSAAANRDSGFGTQDSRFGVPPVVSPKARSQGLHYRHERGTQIPITRTIYAAEFPMFRMARDVLSPRGVSDITSYRDLLVWQRAVDLVDLVYEVTARFPDSERFGLSSQMRRAAVSIPSNIAEGSRHRTSGYINRVMIALGEHAELGTQTIISERRRYIDPLNLTLLNRLSTQVGQLAHGLLRSLKQKRDSERRRRSSDSRVSNL